MSEGSFFRAKNKKPAGAILIDVGSGSVGAALVVYDEREKPKIFFETREHFPIELKFNYRKILSSMTAALDKVVGKITELGASNFSKKSGNPVIKKIICQFSSPWHVSTTKSLNFKFEKDFLLTPHFIEDVLSYESKSFLDSTVSEAAEDYLNRRKSMVVEQEIFTILVNGYPIRYPVDRKAKEFEMTIFLSAFPNAVIDAVLKSAGRRFPDIRPDFHSATIIYSNAVKELFPYESSFTVVNISGETTDVSVVKNNVITETVSFPLGRNFIVRKLMTEIKGISPAIALSMIKVHSEGDASPEISDKLKNILSKAESDWMELFADSMGDFADNFFLPTAAYIFAENESAQIFADLISRMRLTVRGAGTPTISAVAVELSLFENFLESRQKGENGDPFIASMALFLNSRHFGTGRS